MSSCRAPNTRMLEVLGRSLRPLSEHMHVPAHGVDQTFLMAGRDPAVDAGLQAGVQMLVGVEFGGGRRQAEHFDGLPVCGEPLPDLGDVVHLEVVQDQEDLPPSIANELGEEADRPPDVEGLAETPEPYLALIRKGGDHAAAVVPGRDAADEGLAAGGIAAAPHIVGADPGLVPQWISAPSRVAPAAMAGTSR